MTPNMTLVEMAERLRELRGPDPLPIEEEHLFYVLAVAAKFAIEPPTPAQIRSRYLLAYNASRKKEQFAKDIACVVSGRMLEDLSMEERLKAVEVIRRYE